MTGSVIHTGREYLSSKVHGIWGNSVHGERLNSLVSSATEDSFFRSLQSLGIVGSSAFAKSAMERQGHQLFELWRKMSGPCADFYKVHMGKLSIENLRIILNYRYFPERVGSMHDMLLDLDLSHDFDYDAAVKCSDTEAFIGMLDPSHREPHFAEIIRELAITKDLMRAECQLDKLEFEQMLSAVRKLPAEAREVVMPLVRTEIDIVNVMMLLRNVETYRFDGAKYREFCIEGGTLSVDELVALSGKASAAEATASLPRALRLVIGSADSKELHKIENAMWRWFYRQCVRIFYDFTHPLCGVLVFPYLLRFECLNLCRIYEGVRFSLPARVIRELLIEDIA